MIYTKVRIYTDEDKIFFCADRNKYLVNCAHNKKVLHIGCTDFPVTESRIKTQMLIHKDLVDVAKSITGIDISEDGIRLLEKYNIDRVIKMDAESISIDEKYELILAGDVVEHMSNPGKFLEKVPSLLTDNGELIVSVPSAYSFNVLKLWFLGNEQVHKDHVFYFSPKTLAGLCGRYGLYPTKLYYTVQPRDEYESLAFIRIRNLFLKAMINMAPSIIMHFRPNITSIDKNKYIDWG